MTSTPNGAEGTSGEQRGPEDDLVSEDPDLSTGDDPTVDEGPSAEAPDEDGLGMADPPTDQPSGEGVDPSQEDPDLGVPDMAATEQPSGGSGQNADPGHPSQAEGDDPADPADAEVQPAEGHPSQAEG
ncbi:hypothetical protein [Microbacterium sp. NPDC096154]|uniref:hypothetical protein n=1 Tax=Microbacterium sp. NPDC096154 TaxID=3155549 RepID=UPI00331BB9C9